MISTQVDWNTTTIDVLTVETASAELTKFLEARGFARVFCVALDSVFVAACVETNILRRVRRVDLHAIDAMPATRRTV